MKVTKNMETGTKEMVFHEKFYVEVNRASGSVSIIDIDIPAWGTPRGQIEEHETLEEAQESVRGWTKYFNSID